MLSEKSDGKMAKAGLIKKPRQKKCKHCKERFIKTRPIQPACGYECEVALAVKSAQRKQLKREREAAKKERAYKAETRAMKQAANEASPKWWAARLKKVCHLYIRTRDAMLGCISCGTMESKKWDAGHYIPSHRGAKHRYSELNINKQCCACNDGNKLSGNLTLYRIGLVKKIGAEAVEEIERTAHDIKRWTIPEMQELERYYKNKLELLK